MTVYGPIKGQYLPDDLLSIYTSQQIVSIIFIIIVIIIITTTIIIMLSSKETAIWHAPKVVKKILWAEREQVG